MSVPAGGSLGPVSVGLSDTRGLLLVWTSTPGCLIKYEIRLQLLNLPV